MFNGEYFKKYNIALYKNSYILFDTSSCLNIINNFAELFNLRNMNIIETNNIKFADSYTPYASYSCDNNLSRYFILLHKFISRKKQNNEYVVLNFGPIYSHVDRLYFERLRYTERYNMKDFCCFSSGRDMVGILHGHYGILYRNDYLEDLKLFKRIPKDIINTIDEYMI